MKDSSLRTRFAASVAVSMAIMLGATACGSDAAVAPPAGDDLPAFTGPSRPLTTEETTTTDADTSNEGTTSADADQTTVAPTTTSAPTTSAAPPPTVPLPQLELQLEPIARLQSPIAFAQRPDTTDLFVAERAGRVQNISSQSVALDVSNEVSLAGEQGLLGIVFSPDGAHLFVHFTDSAGNNLVRRYDMDGAEADPATAVDVISIQQERRNHNGGHLAFGPDGFLYIGMGDGGGGGDPGDNGQDPSTLLGSMLRIDPTDDGYDIPADNPFASGGVGAPEVFMWGLRNPWRYAFDSATGDLWIGDVGQDRFEEVSVARAADGGGNGENFGWNELEGDEIYRDGTAPAEHVLPLATYSQSGGRCSVTGGEVYRGSAIPSLEGVYVFGDFCNGEILGIDADGDGTIVSLRVDRVEQLVSFGADAGGELYVISLAGTVYRITG